MRCHLGLFLGLLFAMVTTACESGGYYAGADRSTKPGLMLAPESEAVQDSRALEPSANPLQGAFFSDGESADVRARGENYFAGVGKWAKGANEGFDDFGPAETSPAPSPDPAADPAPAPVERLLIYQGQIAVEVARPEESIAAFLAQVKRWGGYMQSQVGNRITVRLPAKLFENAFEHVRVIGRVLSEQRTAQDVTEEFMDLGIRIDNARTSRDRLLEILKQADKVEDILKIEDQLRRLTDEIERMEGRRKFLSDQVALATLQVDFQGVAEPPPVKRKRQPSRFHWINLIGAERVMEDF